MPLADVTQALERFISTEHLDSGYKCEQCGKLGMATKTSKLASIPPILTLHLKRFRYESGKKSHSGGGVGAYHGDNGGGTCRTIVGSSGSEKIEGHVGFDPVLDIKPYLTPQLEQTDLQMGICRLFAVVVHKGKSSHSGHYVAYVHTKDKWWLLNDASVVRSSWDEVRNAEAYMLFYRVTSHPVAMQLKSIADQKEIEARSVMNDNVEVGSLANPPATTTDARKTRKRSRAKSADGYVITIESSEDEGDDTSNDEVSTLTGHLLMIIFVCASLNSPFDHPQVAPKRQVRPRLAVGDVATIDAVRIAIGKKVVKRKCTLSFHFGTTDPYLQISFENNGRMSEHRVYLKNEELREVKYYIPDNTAEGNDIVDSMTVIAFRITPTTNNNLNKYSSSYDQVECDNTDIIPLKRYVSVEFRDADDFKVRICNSHLFSCENNLTPFTPLCCINHFRQCWSKCANIQIWGFGARKILRWS
jgi:hypothetical protein